MKSLYARSLWTVLGLVGLSQSGVVAAEPMGSSLLPMPSSNFQDSKYNSYVQQTAFRRSKQDEPSPSDRPIPMPTPATEPEPFTPPPTGLSSDYESAMKQSWQGGGSTGTEAKYGNFGIGGCLPGGGCTPRYYAYAGGLVLGRANQRDSVLTQQTGTFDSLMGTNAASQKWSGGVEGRLGWIMPNSYNAVEVTYWGIYPSNQSATVQAPDYVGGITHIVGPNLDKLSYSDGVTSQTVCDWMTTTTGEHMLQRSYGVNNVEANMLGNTYAWGVVPYNAGCGNGNACGSQNLQFGWLAGLRYFQFNEGMSFNSDYNDLSIGDAGDLDELKYSVITRNTLLGFQLGGQGSYYVNNNWSLYGSGRAGMYNNHVESSQSVAGLNGDATISVGSYAGQAYRFNSTQNALAGIGQIDLGTKYQLGSHWSINSGYRMIGVAGVATAPGQIPSNFVDVHNATHISASDALVLHGGYMGAQYAW